MGIQGMLIRERRVGNAHKTRHGIISSSPLTPTPIRTPRSDQIPRKPTRKRLELLTKRQRRSTTPTPAYQTKRMSRRPGRAVVGAAVRPPAAGLMPPSLALHVRLTLCNRSLWHRTLTLLDRPKDSMPSVNNYPLLPTEPSPSPQDLPSLLTWGTLLSTPRTLDGSSDPLDGSGSETGRKFRLPETSRRDTLGRKLADKASRAMNERARSYTLRPAGGSALSAALRSAADKTVRGTPRGSRSGEMGPPGAGPMTPKASGLTPAGRMLLERSLGRTPGSGSGSPAGGSGRGKFGLGVGGGRRGEMMEKAGGWGGSMSTGAAKGARGRAEMGWTPSPARSK